MDGEGSVQGSLRRQAVAHTAELSAEQRENLLIGSWMSHDARWFNAVAGAYGLEAANKLNRQASYELGRVEARRIVSAAQLTDVQSRDRYLLTQETIISVLGPNLLGYELELRDDDGWEIRVERCFAFENVTRAGIAGQYECGIFPRVTGWMDSLGLHYEMTPAIGACLRARGNACAYAFRLTPSEGRPS